MTSRNESASNIDNQKTPTLNSTFTFKGSDQQQRMLERKKKERKQIHMMCATSKSTDMKLKMCCRHQDTDRIDIRIRTG
jgi:hypothetical protein